MTTRPNETPTSRNPTGDKQRERGSRTRPERNHQDALECVPPHAVDSPAHEILNAPCDARASAIPNSPMFLMMRNYLNICVLAAAVGWAATGCAAVAGCESDFADSPQFGSGCNFHNIPNPDAKPSQGGFMSWARFLLGSKQGTVPVDQIPVHKLDRAALEALDPNANHVVRLGHSSHLLKLKGSYWLIDPVFSERASPVQWAGPKRFHPTPIKLDELPPIDGVIISHDYYDHLDLATLNELRERVKRFFVPLAVGVRLRDAGIAPERIQELDWWEGSRQGNVEVTATPAQHFSGRTMWDRHSTLWGSWVIESGGERIFYTGDSGYFPGFKKIGERFGSFDLAMVENGAYSENWSSIHMRP